MEKNPFTPFYHNKPTERLVSHAAKFYHKFRDLFMDPKRAEASNGYFSQYAEGRYKEGVPLEQAIYALILMRRQIWLYAEFQATFSTAVEKQQAIDSVTRTMLMFDYAMYFITKKYRELMKLEWFEAPNT